MAALIGKSVQASLQRFEHAIISMFFGRFPPDDFGLVLVNAPVHNTLHREPHLKQKSLMEQIFGDGFLWAVPRNRRSVEKRLMRKFGSPKYVWKMLRPKRNLLVCNTCGHYYEEKVLCPNCYEKVKEETEALQTAVQTELGLSPVDKEVIIIYEGEKEEQGDEFWQGKRVVELKKPRPSWFSNNLLQKTTTLPSASTDVKPTDLG